MRRYSKQVVPVANTRLPEYGEFRRSERPLREVLDLWAKDEEDGRGLYVKDWHLLAELEAQGLGVEEVYEVPECFRGTSTFSQIKRRYELTEKTIG